jgi:hypothetical protein
MIAPIFDQLTATWPHYHQHHQPQEEPMPALTGLIEAIKQDLANAGHAVDTAVHDVLTHHLSLANTAAHVADEVDRAARSPWAQLAEKYLGLPASVVATAVHIADVAAGDLAALAQPAPAEGDAPVPG